MMSDPVLQIRSLGPSDCSGCESETGEDRAPRRCLSTKAQPVSRLHSLAYSK